MANKFLSGINVTGTTTLNTVANAGTDTDKFLVLDASGNVDFRTGDELYADLGIGSLPAGYTSTLKHAVKAGVALTKGQAVYVTSADGTNMIVGKASNASEATSSKTLGLIETSLSINGIGNVITEGLLAGLDTTGAAAAGDPVWLGTDGNLIYGLLNKPYAPAHLVFIGVVTRRNANNGEIFVKVQNGFELNEIHDIDLKTTTPINGHVLGYDGTLWVNKTIAGWLGYTPADDSSVVKLSGAQTVGGLKTFSASIIANIGVLLKNGAVSSLSGYTAIGGSSSNNGIDIAIDTSGYTQSLLFQTGASYAYTFPAATGTVALTSNLSAYVPTSRTITINGTSYDLSADRSWTVTSMVYPSAGIAVSTGTAWGTSITDNSSNWNTAYGWGNHASAGYVPGARELTINGTTYDLTANRSWTIDATSVSTRTIQKFTSTASQTTFTITGGYAVGMVDVWVNGVKLDNAVDFTASNGTTVVLTDALTANQIVEVYKYGSQFISNNALRQKTLFTATAGQTTFTVAYSVGLVDVFYNGSKLDDSEYTATNGTSIVFGTACAVNDKVEVIAYSYNVNGFTGIGGSGTTNYIPKFTASGTIGNSLVFDNGTNVGIGTTSPNSILEIKGSTTTNSIRIGSPNGSGTYNLISLNGNINEGQYIGLAGGGGTDTSLYVNSGNAGSIIFRTGNGLAFTERMRITSAGNVGIGTSSPSDYSGHNTLHINGKSGSTGGVLRLTSFNGVSGVNIYTDSGGICFNTTTSSPFIWYRQDVEVMRMTSGSTLTIGSSAPAAGNYKIYTTGLGGVWADASNPGDAAFVGRGETGYYFYGMNTFSVLKFNVAQSGQISSTSTSITAISDIRHKENIRPIEKGLNEIMQLKPSRFDWKEGKGTGKKDVAGFIAQDIENVLPDLVDEWKESMTTNETFKSIRMGDLIPYLVKAIQEQQAQIEELKKLINK